MTIELRTGPQPAADLLEIINDLVVDINADIEALVANGNDILVTATGSTAAITLADRFAEVVNVKNFGAVGDGVADDTAAFNAVTDAVRGLIASSAVNATIVIPQGTYSISSWDLTELLARSVYIMGYGAKLVARTAGLNVVDCIGSRFLRFYGLRVLGQSSARPLAGFQLGPVGTETCGNNSFHDVECLGEYSRAAFANLGSETTSHFSCTYQNTHSSGYAYIGDGVTQFVPESEYATITRTTPGTGVSFTNNAHYATQFRQEGGGEAVFLSGSRGWLFDQGCYYLVYTDAAFHLYATSTYRNSDLNVAGLFETSQNSGMLTGIEYCFALYGDGTSTAIDGLTVNTSSPHCSAFVFINAGTSAYRLSNVNLRVESLQESGAEWFSGMTGDSVDGQIWTREAAKLNLDDLAKFNGTIRINDTSALVRPIAGRWEAWGATGNTYFSNKDAVQVLDQSAVQAAHTGDTDETVLATISLPAGIMGANGALEILHAWSMTSSGNAKTMRIRLGGIGGTILSSLAVTTNTAVNLTTRIANRNSASSQYATSFSNRATDVVMATIAPATGSENTGSAQDLVITGQCANGADTVALESYIVKLTNESGAIA